MESNTGKVGHQKEYDELVNSGQLVTDPSTFDFDEEISKKPKKLPKYYELFEHRSFVLSLSYENSDKFLIEGENFKKKVYCYQSYDPHTIGRFIVLPGWDEIIYFDTKKEKIIKKRIR